MMIAIIISFLVGVVATTVFLLFYMLIPFKKFLNKRNREIAIETIYSRKEQSIKDEEKRKKYGKEQQKRIDSF